MDNLKAEEYRKNYEYAEKELNILRGKVHKNQDDLRRILMLEDIYFEQKFLYKRCIKEMEENLIG